MSDRLIKFLFRGAPVRGELVHVSDAWREMTAHQSYPPPVKRLLGEMVAAAALLASNIKFNGALIMQVYGDGPVKLLVVECQPDLALRATAKLRDEPVDEGASMGALINRGGRGRFAITLDPRAPLPGHGGGQPVTDEDAWDRAITLGATVQPEELLRLTPETLARRLYGQEKLDHQATLVPRFACTCSRERIGRMLVSLGQEEVDSIIHDLGTVHVTCDFCSREYSFDAVDVAQLFASGDTARPDDRRH